MIPMVVKTADRLKMPSNCNFVKVLLVNKDIANNKKILPYHKMVDKRLIDIQKPISLATSTIS